MSLADKKLKRYKHLYDRFSEILHFEAFSIDETNKIINGLSEITFTQEAVNYIHQTGIGLRQIVKLINKAETMAKANNYTEIDLKCVNQILKKGYR